MRSGVAASYAGPSPEGNRFDAALVVPGPFAAEGKIGHQVLSGGPFAVTTHVGPYETLPAAYGSIFQRVVKLRDYQLVGLPAVEIYHTTRVNVRHHMNHTDLCLPVVRRGVHEPGGEAG